MTNRFAGGNSSVLLSRGSINILSLFQRREFAQRDTQIRNYRYIYVCISAAAFQHNNSDTGLTKNRAVSGPYKIPRINNAQLDVPPIDIPHMPIYWYRGMLLGILFFTEIDLRKIRRYQFATYYQISPKIHPAPQCASIATSLAPPPEIHTLEQIVISPSDCYFRIAFVKNIKFRTLTCFTDLSVFVLISNLFAIFALISFHDLNPLPQPSYIREEGVAKLQKSPQSPFLR